MHQLPSVVLLECSEFILHGRKPGRVTQGRANCAWYVVDLRSVGVARVGLHHTGIVSCDNGMARKRWRRRVKDGRWSGR